MQHQTPDATIRIPSISDEALLDLLEELRDLAEDSEAAFTVRTAHVALSGLKSAEEAKSLLGPDHDWAASRSLTKAESRVGEGISVHFSRSLASFGDDGRALNRREPSQRECEVWVQYDPQKRPEVHTLLEVMEPVERLRLAQATIGPQSSDDFVGLWGRQVGDLTQLSTKILRDIAGERRAMEKEFADRIRQADAERARLEEELHAKAQAEAAALAERQARLDERAKELDDRGHMHARRELRERISDDIKSRLAGAGVGSSARRLRLYIATGGMALMGAFATFAIATVFEYQAASETARIGPNLLTYILLGRLGLSAAAIGGLGFYLLGWARKIHDNDLRSDRELERYRYDIDRASWAIETILEAQAKEGAREGGEVPDEWISGATHGLFARSDPREDDNPNEALGALLNYAAEAEIGPAGTKLKLTPRGVRRLKRSGLVSGEVEG